jgi:hypothetical protein
MPNALCWPQALNYFHAFSRYLNSVILSDIVKLLP